MLSKQRIPAKLLGRKFQGQGVADREEIKLVQTFKMAGKVTVSLHV